MTELQDRLKFLIQAVENWLHTDNSYLKSAKEKTVEEGYFSAPDVQFAVDTLKETINRESLETWIEQSGISNDRDGRGQNVMCLHAGNLPLVGLQDVLGVLLSGGRYTGKISKKDPYLLPTFLNEAKKTELWGDVDVQWGHNLRDFEGMHSDAILFAGSEDSVPGVMQSLDKLDINQADPSKLIRTAHFSLAYFEDNTPENIRDLTEAIFRYGGQGCRSVAGVISTIPLPDIKDNLVESIHQFWNENPQQQKPQAKLQQQFAYNEAIGNSQIWLNDFVIQEGVQPVPADFTCFWVQGDKQTTADIADRFGDKIQSIYVTGKDTGIPGYTKKTELLSSAQKPPVYWKPDGMDTLAWLCSHNSS